MKIFSSVPRIISGLGCIDALGNETTRMDCGKALIVCDEQLKSLGLLTPLMDSLNKAGVSHATFSGVKADPSLDLLDQSREITHNYAADLVIGLGGGSALDAAKLISIMLTNKGPADAYYGINNIPKPGLPMILIPTTAGTGSEVTNISVMGDPKSGLKKAMISDHMYAKVALLDPILTLGLPPRLTATTGMDALVHAIESYVGDPCPGGHAKRQLPGRNGILQHPKRSGPRHGPLHRKQVPAASRLDHRLHSTFGNGIQLHRQPK